MLLITHIVVALASILQMSIMVSSPSGGKLLISKLMGGFTIVTGIILAAGHPGRLAQSCVIGLVYMAFVAVMITVGERRLSAQA
jgi:hypothetical protein